MDKPRKPPAKGSPPKLSAAAHAALERELDAWARELLEEQVQVAKDQPAKSLAPHVKAEVHRILNREARRLLNMRQDLYEKERSGNLAPVEAEHLALLRKRDDSSLTDTSERKRCNELCSSWSGPRL